MIIGSITAIISLSIIALHFIYKVFQKVFGLSNGKKLSFFMKHGTIFSALVLILIPVALFGIYKPIVDNMLHNHNNIELVEDALYVCQPINQPENSKYIILRLDDVQAYGWTEISIRMMNDALKKNETIVASLIPKNIETDERIVGFFKKNDCNVEVAIHGYDHSISEYSNESDGEFALIDENQAKERLILAKEEVAKITDYSPMTFIPPHNQLSTGAIKALNSEIIPIISSEGKGYFDYDASTWDFRTNTFVYADKVIKDCEDSFSKGDNLCVVMLHPQDFSKDNINTDEELYKEYIKILDYIQSNNITSITFKEIANRNVSS